MTKTKVKVVVPIYKESLSERESLSFKHNAEVLARYPHVIVAPEGLNIEAVESIAPQCEVVRVSKEWLGERGIAGYNNMMLSKEFYELFADCEYILICQTDAWIFSDQLEAWCDAGYDYIGAPWPQRKRYRMPIISHYLWLRRKVFRRKGKIIRQDYFNKVGNGGLSLRRIDAFLAGCDRYAEKIEVFKSHSGTRYNEDWFWALIPKEFNYPDFKTALSFSFDVHPELCYALNKQQLPFGCHGWFKKRNINFWGTKIEGECMPQ